MIGGEQAKTVEPDHPVDADGDPDHGGHFSFTHPFMFPFYGAIIVALIVAWTKCHLSNRKAKEGRGE